MTAGSVINNMNLTELSVVLRLVCAVIVGGLIGMEREHKHRPAGFRTHILICLGATLTALTGQFICREFLLDLIATHGNELIEIGSISLPADPLRLSAQVIAGIGFIGAGSIIVTMRSQVKGLTTAAGLWTTAIVGIAIGVGWFAIVLYAVVLILVAEMLLSKLEVLLAAKARSVNLYVEYENADVFARIKEIIKDKNASVLDMELAKTKTADHPHFSVILSIQFKGKSTYEEITTELARLSGIYSVQEL